MGVLRAHRHSQTLWSLIFVVTHLFTAGDFDLSRVDESGCLFNFKVADVVMVICCCGRRRPKRGEDGAEAEVGCRWAWRMVWAGMGLTSWQRASVLGASSVLVSLTSEILRRVATGLRTIASSQSLPEAEPEMGLEGESKFVSSTIAKGRHSRKRPLKLFKMALASSQEVRVDAQTLASPFTEHQQQGPEMGFFLKPISWVENHEKLLNLKQKNANSNILN